MHLLPGGNSSQRVSQSSTRVPVTQQTEFGETFTFEINERPQSGSKLFITLFYQSNNGPEFVGCMSFGVRKIMQEKSIAKGWYYLLSETLGRRKHLVVSKAQNCEHFQQQSTWCNSTASSSTSSSTVSTVDIDQCPLQRKNVRWGRDTVFNMTPVKNDFDSLHGQDIGALKVIKRTRVDSVRK